MNLFPSLNIKNVGGGFFMNNIEKILKKYCGSLDERIDACKDRYVAALLKERICWEFKQSGEKKLTLDFVIKYIDELITKKFNKLEN